MSRFTLRGFVGLLLVVGIAVVVLFTTTIYGLILGSVAVIVAAAVLYYGGYNVDRWLKEVF